MHDHQNPNFLPAMNFRNVNTLHSKISSKEWRKNEASPHNFRVQTLQCIILWSKRQWTTTYTKPNACYVQHSNSSFSVTNINQITIEKTEIKQFDWLKKNNTNSFGESKCRKKLQSKGELTSWRKSESVYGQHSVGSSIAHCAQNFHDTILRFVGFGRVYIRTASKVLTCTKRVFSKHCKMWLFVVD